MKAAVFDMHEFERPHFEELKPRHQLSFFGHRLTAETAATAKGFPAVCCFAHDKLDAETLRILYEGGTRFIALRSAGFNHVDLAAAKQLGFRVARVPAYSPYSVAEHAIALLLSLNRKITKASARVKELNFSLDGLVGFDLHGKSAGVVGTGRIGAAAARIFLGFGCQVLAFDSAPDPELESLGVRYVGLEELLRSADVVTLHVPLNQRTHHLLSAREFGWMKKGAILINTGRGGLIDTKALISSLKSGVIGGAGLDVYEEEESVFFQDLSGSVLQDDVLARLMTFPNVLITAHQAFLTREALRNIVETTLLNLDQFEQGGKLENEVRA